MRLRTLDIANDYMLHDMRVQAQLLQNNIDWVVRCAQAGSVVAGASDVTDCIVAIAENAQILTSLLSGMLGRREESGFLCDIGTLVEKIAATVAPVARTLNMRLTCEVEDAPVIIVDATLVERAVYNLVSNALRHTPRGSAIALVVREDGEDVLIRIADSGEGLDARGKRILLSEEGESDCDDARGMGLHIVRALTDEMNGKIAAGQENGGSFIDLLLPKRPVARKDET
jgi:K+-sensing histidine kinase KdpD